MPTGTLKNWNNDRGFGFLTNDSATVSKDMFVHATAFKLAGVEPVPGDVFAYSLADREGRQHAVHLQRIWSPLGEAANAG